MARTWRVGALVVGLAWVLVSALGPATAAQGSRSEEIQGIVSLRGTSQFFDPILPWYKNVEQSISGNAVVVEGQKLLITADLVKNANLLEVRKFGRYPDFPARVVLVDYELNLALLTVADPQFWEGLRPLPLAANPLQTGRFTINRWRGNGGFEQGSGEVVEHRLSTSPFGTIEIPVMRASSAVSGLGWSEAITVEGRLIGLIYSHSEQQIQAVNVDVLSLFLQAARREPYQGFVHRGFTWQPLNNVALRKYFGLNGRPTGVLIRSVSPEGTGANGLQPGDILHKLGPYDIDPEGFITHPQYGAMKFTLAINETLEPTLPAQIEREGAIRSLALKRERFSPPAYRVLPPLFDQPPDLEVFGGLVLQELSLSYLRAWGKDWRDQAPGRLVLEASMNSLREQGEPPSKVVFISKVLPDPANVGYETVENAIVDRLNGQTIRSLEEFRASARMPKGKFHMLDLVPGHHRRHMVFEAATLATTNERIAKRYGIPPR
ncbi:MAG: hypothetical protein OEW39_06455 [Deltaproteobacteria bacterium]|nr:hypothetical protein [Deltaproteobacteria bacterium]